MWRQQSAPQAKGLGHTETVAVAEFGRVAAE